MKGRFWKGMLFLLAIVLIPFAVTHRMNGTNGIAERRVEAGECYIISGQERIPLEEYLTGAVAYYMPIDYEDEAYKVMSVLLRTYVLEKMGNTREIEEELLDISRYRIEEMEVSFGKQFMHSYSRYQSAVQATAGEVARYGEELIEPYFHQVSAGTTNRVTGCPYLVSVDSSQDIQAKNYLSLKTMSVEEFMQGMSEAGFSAEAKLWGEGTSSQSIVSEIALEMRAGEYVGNVVWRGKRIPAAQVQEAFALPSMAFQFEAYEENIRIMTKGIGHGAGLSLYGANEMAAEGKSYREILTYYYSNITVSDE